MTKSQLILNLISRIQCDEDGFAMKFNNDPAYPHYLHVVPMENITKLSVSGAVELRLVISANNNSTFID